MNQNNFMAKYTLLVSFREEYQIQVRGIADIRTHILQSNALGSSLF